MKQPDPKTATIEEILTYCRQSVGHSEPVRAARLEYFVEALLDERDRLRAIKS